MLGAKENRATDYSEKKSTPLNANHSHSHSHNANDSHSHLPKAVQKPMLSGMESETFGNQKVHQVT